MDEATRITSARNLHQVFWLPHTENHGRLRVTYATTSNFSDESLPVVFICPPMFGGRWMILHMDHLAITKGIRAFCFDRPSMGGSDPVPLQDRMKVWLETVPALLKHLNIHRVSLVCHSAGTLYLLNTLYYLRDILYPEYPYVALMAPWVHNEHSSVTLMNMASKLPECLVDKFHNVIGFMAQKVQPAVAWSGGISSSLSGLFQSTTENSDAEAAMLAAQYGTNEDVAKLISKLTTKYFFAEDARGGTEEAKLCLKMGGQNLWLICEDYKEYVKSLLKRETERSTTTGTDRKLRMQVYYAESDMLIGEGGKKYFDECWKTPEVSKYVDFNSQTLSETNHETIIADFDKSALPAIFDEIKSLAAESRPS